MWALLKAKTRPSIKIFVVLVLSASMSVLDIKPLLAGGADTQAEKKLTDKSFQAIINGESDAGPPTAYKNPHNYPLEQEPIPALTPLVYPSTAPAEPLRYLSEQEREQQAMSYISRSAFYDSYAVILPGRFITISYSEILQGETVRVQSPATARSKWWEPLKHSFVLSFIKNGAKVACLTCGGSQDEYSEDGVFFKGCNDCRIKV
jgi:hypothetical protein